MGKILERALCLSCEKELTDAHIVHKRVPFSEGSGRCEGCGRKRFCTRYKIISGKENGDGKA